MNGDHKLIFDKLEMMEVKQDKRHEDNIKTFGKLPCKFHAAMISALWTVFGVGLISALVVILVRKAVAG